MVTDTSREAFEAWWAIHHEDATNYMDAFNAGWQASRAALSAEQAQAVEPVAWWIPKAEQFCLPPLLGKKPFAKAWEPLYTHPAPPASEQIDWQDMYLKAKSEKEAMAAKYEKDIGPLAKVVPAFGERAELIAHLRSYGQAWYCQEAADMLEADEQTKSKSFAEVHPANPDANCKCEHWQSCAECHPTAHPAQQVAVPAEILSAISRAGLTLVTTQHGYELIKFGPVFAHTAAQGAKP